MHRVVKRKINGQKPTVEFNDKGQPYGVAAAEMQSYIGVLARTKAPIWFDTWRQVPLGFDLPPSARKLVLQSVNSKWKQFKSTLTCRYILPFRDEPEKLRTPPEDFSFLEKNHWDIFVADHLSPEFLAKTHSRDESAIDQSITWVLARKDKEGNFKSESTKQKAEEILDVGSVDNIVAHAKLYGFSRMDDLTLHDVDIPVPIPGEVLTVEQAKGTFVAWPKELIVLDVLPKGKSNLKTVKKKKAPKRLKKANVPDDEDCGQEFQVEFGPEYPLQLKRLCCLYELVKKNKMLQMISFLDPSMIGTLACGNIGQRSCKLVDRFKGACDGQHFLIPFNDVNHWALTVVKPNEEVVYYMDPLKWCIDSQEWTEVVDNAIVLYKSTMNKPMLKKKVSWENMAVLYDSYFLWARRGNLEYTEDDINQTNVEFANNQSRGSCISGVQIHLVLFEEKDVRSGFEECPERDLILKKGDMYSEIFGKASKKLKNQRSFCD
ncbi:unnamed protein product [Cuscuta campestris]|uniref:Ubiquitin-like protease family profile domain-containing protein n=1 Tax=Cuscuta campestris TaxID=132261 RepID=A0A484KVN3_9ASTE|nr:unnamed protein product [Cuscuta campestris]